MRWVVLPEGANQNVQNGFSEVLAVHAALLHTGNVLYFSGSQHALPPRDPPLDPTERQAYLDHTRLWDVDTGLVRYIGSPYPIYDVFCSGHALLGNGKLLVAGGTSHYPPPAPCPPGQHRDPRTHQCVSGDPGPGDPPIDIHYDHYMGVRNTVMFDPPPSPRLWTTLNPMHTQPIISQNRRAYSFDEDTGGRWYPSLLTLSDGSVLVAGGHPSHHDSRHSNFMLEIFNTSPLVQNWIDRGDEPSVVQEAVNNPNSQAPETFPRIHLLPSGEVFFVYLSGGGSWIWNPSTGAWRQVVAGNAVLPPFREDSPPLGYVAAYRRYNRTFFAWTSVLLPLLPEENYRARILVIGREQPYTINLNDSNPRWTPTAPRDRSNPILFDPSPARSQVGATPANFSGMRQNSMAIIMPDGKVLVIGGSTTDPRNSAGLDHDAVLIPEEFDPIRGEWKTLSVRATVPRIYHSVSLLLPDGRVWTAGSNHDSDLGEDARELRIEVFEPWYFEKRRSEITGLPESVAYAQQFGVDTPQADSITAVAAIRAGSTTHGFNFDQRYIGLEFSRVGLNQLKVVAPPNGNIAPPGYYLLFLIDRNGVPSKGKFLKLRTARAFIMPISTDPGVTGLYVIGFDNRVWTTYYDPRLPSPDWHDWFPIRRDLDNPNPNRFPQSSVLTAVSTDPGVTGLYVIGFDNRVWTTRFDPRGPGPHEWEPWGTIKDNVFPQSSV
jgi:Domain of unknown function (DUF1929)